MKKSNVIMIFFNGYLFFQSHLSATILFYLVLINLVNNLNVLYKSQKNCLVSRNIESEFNGVWNLHKISV